MLLVARLLEEPDRTRQAVLRMPVESDLAERLLESAQDTYTALSAQSDRRPCGVMYESDLLALWRCTLRLLLWIAIPDSLARVSRLLRVRILHLTRPLVAFLKHSIVCSLCNLELLVKARQVFLFLVVLV